MAVGLVSRPKHPRFFALDEEERVNRYLEFLGGLLCDRNWEESVCYKAFLSVVLLRLFTAIQRQPTLPEKSVLEPKFAELCAGSNVDGAITSLVDIISDYLTKGLLTLLRTDHKTRPYMLESRGRNGISKEIRYPVLPDSSEDFPAASVRLLGSDSDEVEGAFERFKGRIRAFVESEPMNNSVQSALPELIQKVLEYEIRSGLLAGE